MGREIRRVTPDWQHPIRRGKLYPTHDEFREGGQHYRQRDWSPEEATAYQVYETVSEGTPISPVFKTEEELVQWLVTDADGMGIGGAPAPMSREAAERWVRGPGWAPTMMFVPGAGLVSGVDGMSGESKVRGEDKELITMLDRNRNSLNTSDHRAFDSPPKPKPKVGSMEWLRSHIEKANNQGARILASGDGRVEWGDGYMATVDACPGGVIVTFDGKAVTVCTEEQLSHVLVVIGRELME